jgi:hypothetical protein
MGEAIDMSSSYQPKGKRGRRAQTTKPGVNPTKSAPKVQKQVESTKTIGRGGGKNRGDRTDTAQPFSGDRKRIRDIENPHSRGRHQIQGGGKARKGGGKKQKGSYHRPLMEY